MQFRIEDVRTRQDFELLSAEDKEIFKGYLKGTVNKERNIAEYPIDYFTKELKEGDEGFIAPIMEAYKDTTVIDRFGFKEEEL